MHSYPPQKTSDIVSDELGVGLVIWTTNAVRLDPSVLIRRIGGEEDTRTAPLAEITW